MLQCRCRLFGVRYLATLFGLTLLWHRVGGFPAAWLGGLAINRFGDYTWMWYACMAIREAPVARATAAA